MKYCSFCRRSIPWRPGAFCVPVSHVCMSALGLPTPWAIDSRDASPVVQRELDQPERWLEEAGRL